MTRFGTNYQISRPTGVCAATGRSLEPGTLCVVTLCERPDDDGFDRNDFSVEAWESGARPEGLFSFWRTAVQPPDAPRRLAVDGEVLLDLVHRLADDDRPQRRAFRFVLALILLRRRKLRFIDRVSSEDGSSQRWRLRITGADADQPPLEVEDPRLSDDDVRELTTQLGEVL